MATINGNPLSWEATIENGDFNRKLREMEGNLKDFTQTSNQQASSMESFAKKAAGAAAAYLSIEGAAGFVRSMITVRGEFQQLEIAYRTMLKSKEAGDKLMADTVALAATTPFELKEVATGAKQLLAYGFAAKDITANLKMLGNVAAGVSAPLSEVAYVYGTLKTQGRAYAKDIQQFTGRGIPIIAELAKVMGVAEAEVMKFVESGSVGFPQVEQAFKNMTSSSGMFFNLMEAQSQSLTGQLSNLSDSWAVMLNNIGQSNEGLFNDAIAGASTLVENYETVISTVKGLIAVYGAYRAALIVQAVHLRIMQEMQLQVALSGRALSASQALQAVGLRSLSAAQLLYNKALALSPIVAYTAVITALGAAVYALATATTTAEESQKRLAEVQEEGDLAGKREEQKIKQLITVIKSETATRDQKTEAVNKLKEATGKLLDSYSAEEIAAGKANDVLKDYLATVEQITENKVAFEHFSQLNEQLGELEVRGIKAISTWKRFTMSLQNTFIPKNLSLSEWWDGLIDGKASNDKIVEQLKDSLVTQRNDLFGRYGEAFSEFITGIPNVNPGVDTVAVKRTVDVIDKAIAAEKEKQKTMSATTKEWQEHEKVIQDLEKERSRITGELTKSGKKYAEERKKVLESIAEAERAYYLEGLSQNQREIEEARAKFTELRKLAKEAGLGGAVITRIDNLEQKVTGTIEYSQDTEKLQDTLKKQKQLYEEYENYKQRFGIEKATGRYQAELNLAKNYLETIEQELSQFNGIDPEKLTKVQADRKEFLTKELEAERKIQTKQYEDLLKALQTYQEKRKLLIENYQAEYEKLLLAGETASLSELTAKHQEELNALDDANAGKLDVFKQLFEGIEKLSDKAAKKVIEDAKTMLNALVKQGKISKEMADKIRKSLDDASANLKDRMPQRLTQLAGELRGVADLVGDVEEGFGQVLHTVANVITGIVQIGDSIDAMKKAVSGGDLFAGALSGVGAALTAINLVKSIAQGLDAKSDANKQQEAENQRYIFEMQIKQNEAVVKQLERQLELIKDIYGAERLTEYQKSLTQIQREYEEMSKSFYKPNPGQTGSGLGVYALTGTNKELDEAIKKYNAGASAFVLQPGKNWSQQDLNNLTLLNGLIDKLNDPSQKAGALEELQKLLDEGRLDEQTAATVQNLIALEEQYKETFRAIQAEVTGTSFETLVDEVIELFRTGKTAAQDFADSFEKIMDEAVLNSFKRNVIEKEIQAILNSMYEYGKDGTYSAEDKKALEEMNAAAAERMKAQWAAYEEVFGPMVGNNTSGKSGLAGAVRGITETQADLLAGQFGAMRLHMAELVGIERVKMGLDKDNPFLQQQSFSLQEQTRIGTQALQYQQQIANNTAQLVISNAQAVERIDRQLLHQAEHTKSLRSIDTKIGSTNEILRANGG